MCDSWDPRNASCSGKKWVCKACTYENWPRAMKCAICCSPKNYNPYFDSRRPHDIYEVSVGFIHFTTGLLSFLTILFASCQLFRVIFSLIFLSFPCFSLCIMGHSFTTSFLFLHLPSPKLNLPLYCK